MLPFVNCSSYPCFLFCLSKLRSWWNEEPWQKMSGKKCCTANWISLKLTIFERWSKVDQKERCVPKSWAQKAKCSGSATSASDREKLSRGGEVKGVGWGSPVQVLAILAGQYYIVNTCARTFIKYIAIKLAKAKKLFSTAGQNLFRFIQSTTTFKDLAAPCTFIQRINWDQIQNLGQNILNRS